MSIHLKALKCAPLVRGIILCCLSGVFAGCASAPPESSGLERADGTKSFMVAQRIVIKTGTSGAPGFLKGSEEIALLPGRYTAKHQNAQGTYFLGPSPAFVERVNSWIWKKPNLLFEHSGGIWIPLTHPIKAKLWVYPGAFVPVQDEPPPTRGDVAGALATRNIANGTQPAMGPSAAGLGAGLASALVGAMINSRDALPVLTGNELLDAELLKHIADQVSGDRR